ncbi:MAG: uroporphyrinogen decarboxylase family protein [Phycisphaerae bacterium]
MTPKERVRAAMSRKKPDRLPCAVSFNTETKGGPLNLEGISAKQKIMNYLNVDDYEKVLRRLGIDVRVLAPRSPEPDPDKTWLKFLEQVRLAQTVEDLRQMRWPTWNLLWDCRYLREDMQHILDMDQHYAIQITGPCLFEMVRTWRDFSQLLTDWLTDPEFIVTLFEIAYQLYMPLYEAFAQELGSRTGEIDYIYAGGDFGMQDRPLIDPKLFERDYESFVRREVIALKKLFPNAFFEFHCCGSAAPFLPSLVRAGVEVLHPVQPGCAGMKFENLKADWGNRLAFRGGVDAQGTLAQGTVEDVRQWVLYAFRTLGKDGGYIIAPHGIMPEVPVENVLKLFDTVQTECWYL